MAFQARMITARLIRAADGRELIQMRIEMGLLQMEIAGRPDGEHPGGVDTCLDWLRELARVAGQGVRAERRAVHGDRPRVRAVLSPPHLLPGLAAVRRGAIADAEYTLQLMDFVAEHSPNPQWTLSHEQYRPFVLFHRIQAAAMLALEQHGARDRHRDDQPRLERNARGVRQVRGRGAVRRRRIGRATGGDEGVAARGVSRRQDAGRATRRRGGAEEYERAARLRDEIARQQRRTP